MPKIRMTNSLKKEVAKLRERKRKALKQKKKLILRQKEINEIRQLEKEIKFLEGVGTKKQLAKEVSARMGKQAGKVGWKGLKFAGRFVKNVIEAEAREQAMERERDRQRGVTRPKPKRKIKSKPKVRSKVKKRKKRR